MRVTPRRSSQNRRELSHIFEKSIAAPRHEGAIRTRHSPLLIRKFNAELQRASLESVLHRTSVELKTSSLEFEEIPSKVFLFLSKRKLSQKCKIYYCRQLVQNFSSLRGRSSSRAADRFEIDTRSTISNVRRRLNKQ